MVGSTLNQRIQRVPQWSYPLTRGVRSVPPHVPVRFQHIFILFALVQNLDKLLEGLEAPERETISMAQAD